MLSFIRLKASWIAVIVSAFFVFSWSVTYAQSQNPQSGSVGLQGTVSAPPPTRGATITLPTNGQVFTSLPITVTGICPNGLLVKVFKNNIFAGATQCVNGNYSLQIDLFTGRNDLVARVYDSLDQAGPDSNTVTVTFSDSRGNIGSRVSITSSYAKRGAAPGTTLTWPITISGGNGPYAVSIDWGDRKTPDLISRPFPGEFTIQHTYDQAGIYNVIVKVTDKNGDTAFMQVVGVGTGPVSQQSGDQAAKDGDQTVEVRVLWWPVALLIPFTILSFWLGRRHMMHTIRRHIIRGERPF